MFELYFSFSDYWNIFWANRPGWRKKYIISVMCKEDVTGMYGLWKVLKIIQSVKWSSLFNLSFILGQCADSEVCWLMHCRFDPNQGRTILCCLYVAECRSYLCCVTGSTHIRMGESTVWIVFSNVVICVLYK